MVFIRDTSHSSPLACIKASCPGTEVVAVSKVLVAALSVSAILVVDFESWTIILLGLILHSGLIL